MDVTFPQFIRWAMQHGHWGYLEGLVRNFVEQREQQRQQASDALRQFTFRREGNEEV